MSSSLCGICCSHWLQQDCIHCPPIHLNGCDCWPSSALHFRGAGSFMLAEGTSADSSAYLYTERLLCDLWHVLCRSGFTYLQLGSMCEA